MNNSFISLMKTFLATSNRQAKFNAAYRMRTVAMDNAVKSCSLGDVTLAKFWLSRAEIAYRLQQGQHDQNSAEARS